MLCHQPNRLILQFHITGRCNLRCKHCYRTEGDVETLSLDQVIAVLEQFKELRASYNAHHHIQRKAHINLTGGEPFYRKDIVEILRYLGNNREVFTYGILSNGSFITPEVLHTLVDTGAAFVQLSLDGNRPTHDALRAPGDYDRVLKTAAWLEQNGVRTYISFTANRENYRHLPRVARACRKRGVTKLWTDRLVPIGTGAELETLAIDRATLPRYLRALRRAQGNRLTQKRHPKTQVTANRALQFLEVPGAACYTCGAGKSLITVDEFGRVMPCRRMPILCGNVFDTPLHRVYWEHEVFRQLRNCPIPDECGDCPHAGFCRGGAKCQSYARYGTFDRADPACPLTLPPHP